MNNKKIIENILILALFFYGLLSFYFARGIFGLEHLLSVDLVSRGLLPFIDFFEHHGPLLYHLFAPTYKLIGLEYFPIFIIALNTLGAWLMLQYIIKQFSLNTWTRIILSLAFIALFLQLDGYGFMPEVYISIILIFIYQLLEKNNNYKTIAAGFLAGLIMAIKWNAFILLLPALFLWQATKTNNKLSSAFKNSWLFLSGLLVSLLPFFFFYGKNLDSVYQWLFVYNRETVLPLAKIWPPPLFSFFSIFLLIILSALAVALRYKKYNKLILPLSASFFLLLLNYPRFGVGHLLPSLIGFLIAAIVLAKESQLLLKIKSRPLKLIVIGTLSTVAIFIIFSSGKSIASNFSAFNKHPESYNGDWTDASKQMLAIENTCSYVYIQDSQPLLYLRLPQFRPGYFNYPDFPWTINQEMIKKIEDDIKEKNIDCFIVKKDQPLLGVITDLSKDYQEPQEIIWQSYYYIPPFTWLTKKTERIKIFNDTYLLYHP